MKNLLLIALLIPAIAFAEITPRKGDYDPRVRVVDYNPLNVVKLVTFYGVSTHVQFGDGETIKDVAIGDDQAWKVVPRGNHLFIKPQAEMADTNVTVVTDKRTYHFALIVQPRPIKDSKAWSDPNLVFSLVFRYPDDEAEKRKAEAEKLAAAASTKNMKAKLANATKQIENIDYWVAGSEEISPTAARDDGRFIYLTFSNNRDMPAVYSVDAEGNEALINTNVIEGNTIVIQRLVPHLILRKGNYVASVINKSFDINGGIDNTTGTIAPDVERVIKGKQQ
jgi:type IV secretion system protein VirB9